MSAIIALGAFTVLFGANLSSVFATNWLMNRLSEGVASEKASLVSGLVHISASIAIAVALLFLLVAVFINTGKKEGS